MYIDYHVHTDYSDDSTYLLEDVIKDAINMGLKEIAITDHVDYGIKKDWDEGNIQIREDGEILANVDYPKYFNEIRELSKKYPEIKIRAGMEFGVQVHTIPQFTKLYNKYHYDFIIMSCHQVEDKEFWTQDFQRGRSQKEYNERYYQELLDCGSLANAREKGLIRIEGKEYIMQDGDVVLFRFNV